MTTTVPPVNTSRGVSTSIDYIPYLESDVTAIVNIVKESSGSNAVVAALVLNDQLNTDQSYATSQNLLKKLLQEELVQKASGAIRPKLSRYADLIFFMEDGRLYLDGDELPVFRPGNEDGSIHPLQRKVSQVLIQDAKEKAEDEVEEESLSVQLLNKVLGCGTEKDLQTLRHLSVLSHEINEELGRQKNAIREDFLRATDLTTNDQLEAMIEKKEADISSLQEKLKDEIQPNLDKCQTDLEKLESAFRENLSSLDLEGDLFDVDNFLQDNTDFSVISKAFEERYELLKSKEKDENKATITTNSIKEQLSRFEPLLKSNKKDRDDIQAEIDNLNKQIKDWEEAKTNADKEKTAAEERRDAEVDNEKGFEADEEAFKELRTKELKKIAEKVEVQKPELSKIKNKGVDIEELRKACEKLKSADDTEVRCEENKTSKNGVLTKAKDKLSSMNTTYGNLCGSVTKAYNTWEQTVAKVKSGKDTIDNPKKQENWKIYSNLKTTKDNWDKPNSDYSKAKLAVTNAESELETAKTALTTATDARTTASNAKADKVGSVESKLDGLEGNAIKKKLEAGGNITIQKGIITAKQKIIDEIAGVEGTPGTPGLIAQNTTAIGEQEKLLEGKNALIATLQQKVNSLEAGQAQQGLISVNPPVDDFTVWLDGESWDDNMWKDKSDNENHPRIHGTVNKGIWKEGNSKSKTAYLYGDTNSGVTLVSGWPSGKDFTFFHVTKYNGKAKERIWRSNHENWLSGHHKGDRGVFNREGVGWLAEDSVGDGWGLFTHRESKTEGAKVRVDGEDVTKKSHFYGGPRGVGINVEDSYGITQYSDWAAAMVLVYDRALSDDEMKSVEDWIRTKYYPTDLNPPVDDFTVWLDGESWDDNMWKDKSDNENHPRIHGTVNKGIWKEENSKRKTAYLYGDTNSGVTLVSGWPSGKDFTFFHVTKYNGKAKERIWRSNHENWLSGHHKGDRGVFYHEKAGWLAEDSVGDGWGLFTHRESKTEGAKVRVDGEDVTKNSHFNGGPRGVGVNVSDRHGIYQYSDWAAAMVLVYDRALSDDEMKSVEDWIRTNYYPTDVNPLAEIPVPTAVTSDALTGILEERKRISKELEGWTGKKVDANRCIADLNVEIEALGKEIEASPSERLEKREAATAARDTAMRDAVYKSAAQIEALVVSAGYRMFGAWGGRVAAGHDKQEEDSKTNLLRALVADIRGLTRPTKIRTSQPSKSFEQLIGADVDRCDIEAVEYIVKKLRAKVQFDDINHINHCVRDEFTDDLDMLPSHGPVVINELKDSTSIPSRETPQWLLYKQETLYGDGEEALPDDASSTAKSCEWVLLHSASSLYTDPLEDTVEKLSSMGESEWALESCARYLLTSWLTSKSMALSSIEELSSLVSKLEDMSSNSDLAVEELRIFDGIAEKEDDLNGELTIDTTLRVAASIVSRLRSLHEAVVDAERNIVSSTNTAIVAMAARAKKCFVTFCDEFSKMAVYLVKFEIQRRKTSILTGDYDNLGGANVEHASSLNDTIDFQTDELNNAKREKEELEQELKKILDCAESNSKKWLEKKEQLEAQIAQLEKDIEIKNGEMSTALEKREENEKEILKQLEDTNKLREELSVLQNQKKAAKDKYDAAKNAADKAADEVTAAEGELTNLRASLGIVEGLITYAENRKKEHGKWKTFMENLAKELTGAEAGITKHLELVRVYQKTVYQKTGHTEMFKFIGANFPNLKEDADKLATACSATQTLDLRKALNQLLVTLPSVDVDVSGSGIISVQGISLSYKVIESALENFVTNRCSKSGLCFDNDGNLAVKQGKAIPSINNLPRQIQEVIRDRIQRYIAPNDVSDDGKASWAGYEEETKYDKFAEMLVSFDRGIKKWDVLREYAKTIEVIVAKTVVIDKDVMLPGFNFFVKAGENINIQEKCCIDTSPSETIEFKHEKAKNGDEYKSNDGNPKGHNGDHGLYGNAGMNAGHVTLDATQTLSWSGQLTIRAVGAKGSNGQTGGDGEKGREGLDGPTVPEDSDDLVNGWGGCQATFCWSRPPGVDSKGRLKPEERSGPGGDGGAGGLGGQGGSGGQIVLRDANNPQNQSELTFGDLQLDITNNDGDNGEDGGHGNGGKGGTPGNQKADCVFNKTSFFVTTKKESGILKEEHLKDGLSTGFLGLGSLGAKEIAIGVGFGLAGALAVADDLSLKAKKLDDTKKVHHKWGASEHVNKSFPGKELRKKAFGPNKKRDGGMLATGADGKNGEERMNSTERKERKMRKDNNNISLEQEYQSQQYTKVQSLNHNDAFAQAGKTYASESDQMTQEIDALGKKKGIIDGQIESSTTNLAKVQKQSTRLSAEKAKLKTELEAINNASNLLQQEVTEKDKQMLSKILASLEQTEEITKLTIELSDLLVDSKYEGQLANKLQAVISTLETRAILRKAEILQQQELLDKKIAALTTEIMRAEKMKGELANVNIVSQLDALLSRALALNNEITTSQQQRKQKSVQVECDDDDNDDDNLVGVTILLSVRDTFVHSSSPDSVWPDLAFEPNAKEAINAILSSISSIPEEKRALTLELLEILTRYSIFNKRFEILEGMLPLEDQTNAHDVVLKTFREVKEDLAIDHWFIGSIAGVSIMMSSTNNITVDEASLTCRYEGIESVPIGQSLTKNERNAVKFVRNLEAQGYSFQELAQFLKQYTDAVQNAISLKGNGFLAVLQGKPVKFIDKFTRMILTALERDDHELAVHNIEIAIGMANIIQQTIDGLGLLVHHNSLLRKRDMRGRGGGFTRLFLDNAKDAQDLLDANPNQREDALALLRSKREQDDQTTIYGPKDFDALMEEIFKIYDIMESEVVSNTLLSKTLLGVARALSGGIAVENNEQLEEVLARSIDIGEKLFSNMELEEAAEAAEGALKVIATVCLDLIGEMYGKGDDNIVSIIRNAGVSRLNVTSLPATQCLKRVSAFFRQFRSYKFVQDNAKFLLYLKCTPLSYPANSKIGRDVMKSLHPDPDLHYEDAVEDVARDLVFEWIDSTEENAYQDPHGFVQKIVELINDKDIPILCFLLPLALQILSVKAVKNIEKDEEGVPPNTLEEIRDRAESAFEQIIDQEKAKEEVDRIVSAHVFNLPADKLHSLWMFLCEGGSRRTQEDIGLIVLAIAQGRDNGSIYGRAHSQLYGASFLWSKWPDTITQNFEALSVLHEISMSVAKVVFKRVLWSLSQYPTTATPYLRELVEETLNVIGKYLKPRPTNKTSRDLYAKLIKIVLALNTKASIILKKKKEAERTTVLSEMESEHLSLDKNLTKWILGFYSQIFQFDFDEMKVSEGVEAFSSSDLGTEAENFKDVESKLRGILKGVLEAERVDCRHFFARCVYITIISWSEHKHEPLIESSEATNVAKVLFRMWNNDPSRNDFLTAGLAIFQSLVLHIREREYETINNCYTCNDSSQAKLVGAAAVSLPKTTASTSANSPALLSENSRRVQFWKVCLSQINDATLHSSTAGSGGWETIKSDLSNLKENSDIFENALIENVNRTIYNRREEQRTPEGKPEVFAGQFRDGWAKENWMHIETLLQLTDPTVPASPFDFNIQLKKVLDAIAKIINKLKNIKSTKHADAMGWLFKKLSDAYCGMYIVPDDKLEGQLSRMISEISSLVINPATAATLSSSAKHLVETLELMNPRLSRYSKVKKIMEKNFERSELKHELSCIDDKCERAIQLASKLLAASATGGAEIKTLYDFVTTLRVEQKFGFTVGKYENKINEDVLCQVQNADKILTKEEAVKWFLSIDEGSVKKNPISFKDITIVSNHMPDKNAYEQELVQGAYRALFEQLGGRLHYVYGMALESNFNLARNAFDQQAATKQEYYKAAQMGSRRAYNNMLCNSFLEARQQRMSFESARSKVLPAFQKLAESDRKAKTNLELLKNDKRPTDRYSVRSPVTEITSNNSDFINLKSAVNSLVSFLEKILYACSRGTDTHTLSFLVGEGVDQLYESLGTDEPVLVELTERIKEFISGTKDRIVNSPPLSPMLLYDLLVQFYGEENLDSVKDWGELVLLLPDFKEVSTHLFHEKGHTIIYQSKAMDNDDGVNFVIRLLPKIVSERVVALERGNVNEDVLKIQTPIVQRLGNMAITNLTAYRDRSADEGTEFLQKAQMLMDYVMFEDWDNLYYILRKGNLANVFSPHEETLAKILSDTNLIYDATHDDISKKFLSPALWQDRLADRALSHLLDKFSEEDIKKHLSALKENFWSPSIPRDEQKPLDRAENELKKVEDALDQIFLFRNVSNLTYCSQQYQHIYNASHYILYLTTFKYIADVRCPEPVIKEEFMEQVGETEKEVLLQKWKEWKSKREKVELESREMVKKIKAATETVIDCIGILKKVHERLLAMEAIFHHDTCTVYAFVDKLLGLPASSNLAIECILWMLQTSNSGVALSFLQNEIDSRNVTLLRTRTLEAVMYRLAFNLIESNVLNLTTAMNSKIRNSATSRVLALRQQELPIEGGISLLKLLVKTTNKMIYHENKPETSKISASKEEIEALVESLKMLVEINVWNRKSLLIKLEAYSVPSRWLPELKQQSVAIALSYNPDTTSKVDEEHFMKAASAIDRIRQRRGSLVAGVFLQCLQLLVKCNADAFTLSTIAGKVSSNRWDFSAADKADYEIAAKKGTGEKMLEYLEAEAERKRKVEFKRSMKDLTGIMNEEVTGINKSIGHFLCEKENKSCTELEWRVQCIDEKLKADRDEGKSIADWEKTDIIEWSKDFKKCSKSYFTKDHTDQLNEMIAVFKRVGSLIKGEDLRNPQLLAIIIFIDGMVQDKGLLGEIGTGEGKTVITILSTAARVFKGETVDVLSSSRVLAERDSIEAKEWFDYFDISVSCNCDDEAEENPSVRKKRYHASSVVYGEAGAFQRDLLLTEFYDKDIRKKVADSLVIDEVDSLLIDEMANTLFISHEIQDLRLLNEIFVSIWMLVNAADASIYSEGSVALVKQYINKQISEGKLAVPSWLKDFADSRLETWIRNAYKAKFMTEGDQYILLQSGLKRGQVTVVNLYTGIEMPNTKWSNGLHQFVSLKHNNKLTAESLKAIFLANVNYVKKYGQKIIGMTGTLGATAELSLMKNVYGVTAFRMPRFMSERFYEDPATVVGSGARWIELVADHVVEEQQNIEGFDASEFGKEKEKQEDKLDKAQRKLNKYEADVKKCTSRMSQITAIRNKMSRLSSQYFTPSDLNSHALDNIESLVKEIEESHFKESNQSAKEQFVDPLQSSVSEFRRHNEEVNSETNASAELYKIIQDLERQKKEISFTDPTSSSDLSQINDSLNSSREEKATVDDNIESLKGHTNTKGDTVLNKLTSMEQGLTRPIAEYIQDVQAKKKKDERKVTEYEEEVKDRKIKFETAKNAEEKGIGGRAVLVICRNKNDADDVAATLAARKSLTKLYRYTGTNDSITELNPQTGAVVETKVNLGRLCPRDVIVATNIAGRGTSLKTTKVVEQCGGLHVLLAYVPSNIRVEMQAWGRTSRHGKNGSGKFIVCDPRVSISEEVIDIDYLLSERDLLESDRLEKVEVETIPRVNMEKELFDNFSAFSKEISKHYCKEISSELQRKELRDQWAFFLEEQDTELEQYFKNPTQAKQRLLESFEDFKEERKNDLDNKDGLGLITLPGNCMHVVSQALRKEAYGQAQYAAQKIIDADPNFAGYGYYYKALARFEKGIDNANTMKKAMNELEMAVFLFNKEVDSLQRQSQTVSSVNSAVQKRGIGTNSNFFEKSIANTISLLRAHISAAEKASGRAIQYQDFDTSVINGDSTKEVFDMLNGIAKEKEKIRKNICPQCVSERVEIRLRITAKDRAKVDFLTSKSNRKGDQNKVMWMEDTLEVCGDVTDEEMEQVKELDLPWEFALYVVGDIIVDTANSDDKSSLVVFPPSVAYAVPKMIENLRKIAKDGKLKGVGEEERSNLDDLFFNSLLPKEKIKKVIDEISDGSEQNYLVLDTQYNRKATAKWDSQGFCGIGPGMKKWLLKAASSSKVIPESKILAEAQQQLTLNGENNADNTGRGVLTAILELGIGKIKKMRPVKKEKIEIIKSRDKMIVLKLDITDDKINEVSFESFAFLERHKDAILAKLKESKGAKLKASDFDVIFTAADERFEFVQSNSFFYLQQLLQVHGIAKKLCEQLELKEELEEHFKGPIDDILEDIDEMIDSEKTSGLSVVSELEGSLVNQEVIHMPRVRFGIDKSKDDIDDLKKSIQEELKKGIKALVGRIKEAEKKKEKAMKIDVLDVVSGVTDDVVSGVTEDEKKEEAMMEDILAAVEGTITELVKLKPKIKVEFQTLPNILGDETPPELRDFMETAVDITFKVVKEKVFSDYWDWGAFAVAMLGILQIASGAALMIFTGGTLAQLGGALIAEGAGDIMYAAVAGFTGAFTWKEYGIQKSISLLLAVTSIASGGITTILTKQAQVAALTTKAATAVVAKAVAKKVASELFKVGFSKITDFVTGKLSEIAAKEVFRTFKGSFQQFVEEDLGYKDEVEKTKRLLGRMMDTYGKSKADKYINDILGDSQDLKNVESKIEQDLAKVAGELNKKLSEAAERLGKSKDPKLKTLGHIAKVMSIAAEHFDVVLELRKSYRCVPTLYKTSNARLEGILKRQAADPKAQDILTETRRQEWIDEHMKKASKVIFTQVEGIVESCVGGKVFGKLVEKGTKKLNNYVTGKLEGPLNKLQKHAETVDTITHLSNKKEQLTDKELKKLVKLQKELMEQDNHYATVLKKVDPTQDKEMKVIYNGEEVTLGSLEAKLGTGGLRLLQNSDGTSAPILIRPKYAEFINGMSVDRPANLVDLHAMAKEAKLNVSLEIEESGGKTRTEQVQPHDPEKASSLHIGLLKNDQYPQGQYVLKDENGNTKFTFQSIGAASAAQIIVYQKARNDGLKHTEALKRANSRKDVEDFLKRTKESAVKDDANNESGTRYYYESAEFEKKGDVLGGSRPNPLSLFPEPDLKEQKIKLKPVSIRQRKEVSRELKSQKSHLKPGTQKEKGLDPNDMNSKIPKQIFTRVLGESRLQKSTKVTMAADSEQQKDGDFKIKTSKDTLKSMVDTDSSFLRTASTVEEKPGLDGNATTKLKNLAKKAGIEMAILTRFELTETFNAKKGISEGDTPKEPSNRQEVQNEIETSVKEDNEVMTLSITRSVTKTEAGPMTNRPKWGGVDICTLRSLNTM